MSAVPVRYSVASHYEPRLGTPVTRECLSTVHRWVCSPAKGVAGPPRSIAFPYHRNPTAELTNSPECASEISKKIIPPIYLAQYPILTRSIVRIFREPPSLSRRVSRALDMYMRAEPFNILTFTSCEIPRFLALFLSS